MCRSEKKSETALINQDTAACVMNKEPHITPPSLLRQDVRDVLLTDVHSHSRETLKRDSNLTTAPKYLMTEQQPINDLRTRLE